jgi:hypothetical protein
MARAFHHHRPIQVARSTARPDANPHMDRPLEDLHRACNERAGLLLESGAGGGRAEREALARDTAFLLLAVVPNLASGEDIPGTPAREVLRGGADFVESYWRAHESTLRSARYRTLVMATDLALGEEAGHWRRDGWIDGERVYTLAMTSETGLLRVLSELSKIREHLPRRRQRRESLGRHA